MKNFNFVLSAFALVGLIFVSCNDDDDDYVHYESFVSVEKDQTNTYFYSDKGNVLWPVNQTGLSSMKQKTRAIILFNLAEKNFSKYPEAIKETNEFIHLASYQPILSKPVWDLTEANKDSIVVSTVSPVYVRNAWLGGGYLNLVFSFETDGRGVYHYVNVVNNTLDGAENPKDGVLKLEFIHNSNGDGYIRYATGIASFKLPENLEGVKDIEVKYKISNSETKTIKMPISESSEKMPLEVRSITGFSSENLD